jgi:hypothetical protein
VSPEENVVQRRFTRGRRARAAVVELVVGLIVVAASPAVASAQQAPHQQSAVSPFFGATDGPPFFGSFNAVSDAGGANPSGQVGYRFGGPGTGYNVSATVVCLSVSASTAVIGFQGAINRPFVPPQPVVGELVVADNGPADSGLDTVGAAERDPGSGLPDCSAPGPVQPRQVTGDVIVQPARARMVGKGSLAGVPATASYAYILRCDAASNANAPFEIRFGSQRFRLTATSSVFCTDDPAVPTPAAGFDTMTGIGTGTLTGVGPRMVQFRFVDGGTGGANDAAEILIFGEGPPPQRILIVRGAPPGRFPGSDQATGNNVAQTG